MAGTREIPLTHGAVALVDEGDYERLVAMGKWHLSDTGYAVRRNNGVTIRMHRVVNNTPDGLLTDHKNHDRLDNRKANLRTVTQKENMRNYSGAKGYCWDASKQLWMVRHNKKFYGRYRTEQEAAEAAKQARAGVPKRVGLHPRRKYLPRGVCFMLSQARRRAAPYYINPVVDGRRVFVGYFKTPSEAEDAYIQAISSRGGLTS